MSNPTVGQFFDGVRAGRLTGIKCSKCGACAVPPKQFCEQCGARDWQPMPMSGAGTIASFTIIRVAPRKFTGEVPYAIAAVHLPEGVSLLGRIVDIPVEKVAVGMPVRFRPLVTEGRTAIAFGPS